MLGQFGHGRKSCVVNVYEREEGVGSMLPPVPGGLGGLSGNQGGRFAAPNRQAEDGGRMRRVQVLNVAVLWFCLNSL